MIIKHLPSGKLHVLTDENVVEQVMLMNGWRRENCTFLDCKSGKIELLKKKEKVKE